MGELWQMARDWLRDLQVMPPDSPALQKEARVFDLVLDLQDGTVLCNAVNRIVPGTIPNVHERPDKQFQKMQNINAFLDAASTKFKLKDADLFTAEMLWYASDFPKVMSCLSALSSTSLCKSVGLKPFPQGAGAANTANEGGEDMYQSLEDLIQQNISLHEASTASAAYDPDEDEGDIYGAIRKVVEESGGIADVYSDVLYNSKPSAIGVIEDEAIYTQVANPDDKRNCVLMELMETEKNYVSVLDIIITKFKVTLSKSKLLKPDDVDCIFSNVEELYSVHKKFQSALEAQMASKTGRNVSKPFLSFTDSMKVYGKFCCDVPMATKKLTEMQLSSKMSKILDTATRDSKQRFGLKDLLNVPMQRLLKYPLLIKELIKHTSDNHPDKPGLLDAAQEVKLLAAYINQYKTDYENLVNIKESLKKYRGKPLNDFAPLLKDGDLKYKKDDGKDKLKDAYVFLFERAIILTRPLKVNYEFREVIEITADMEVIDVAFWNLGKEEQAGKYTFAWSVKVNGGPGYVFATNSLPSKKRWMQDLNNAILVAKEEAGIAPAPLARGAVGGGGSGGDGAAAAGRPAMQAAKPSSAGSAGKKPARPVAKKPGKQAYEEWVPINAQGSPDKQAAPAGVLRANGGDEGWFGGKIQRSKAEKILENAPDGTFLVRESHTRQGDYSLSVKYSQNCKHIKINRKGNKYDLAPDAASFTSIQELVEHYQAHSLNRHFPGMETTLAIPFKDTIGRGLKGGMFGQEKQVGIGRARSRFAYTAKSHDELTFVRGIEIIILSMQDQDPGWWKGQLPDGTVGIFPANYVQRL
eukprot:m.40912 g.40912  ORF g.40912 m.40912 type:complete len:809 (+) comp6046_c0_seq2:199-2625(+)